MEPAPLTIYKYRVPLLDHPLIDMPTGARILSCGVQGDTICVWALVNPSAPMVTRRLRLAGTGHPFRPEQGACPFIGTIFYPGGLVFHLFDGGEV